MVELIVNNLPIELPKKAEIKYTKQISDILDIANVACSFTNSFEFDKTPNNTQAMQQLGIIGDGSFIPYQKNEATLKHNGFNLVSKGWFKVGETTETYKGSITDGMVDFFKAIENKTLGKDLNLSNFNHDKLLLTVLASFTNQYYRYLVADYGGKNVFEDGINIDYLTPCFSVRKLWELVFSTFGFTCDYTNLSYLDGLYITYPKDVSDGQENELIATLHKDGYSDLGMRLYNGWVQPPLSRYSWDISTITEGSLLQNRGFVVPETTSYFLDLEIEDYLYYRREKYYSRVINTQVDVLVNGTVQQSILSDFEEAPTNGNLRTLSFNISLNERDLVSIKISAPRYLKFRGNAFHSNDWRLNRIDFKIYKTNLGTTILENELKDFSIKDFIKEIIWRTGLTPVYDQYEKLVSFIKLDDRVNFENKQDLSNCYVKRKGESYDSDYAQKNIFALKKNNEADLTGDGYLFVANQNLKDEQTIAQSKIYVPDKKIVTDFFGFSTNQYKIWETETKENSTGDIEIKYKGLSGKFYFVRQSDISGSFKFISEKLEDDEIVSTLPYAINSNTLFDDAIFQNYQEYQKIFNNFRIHNIELAMTIDDFNGLDLTKPVFFKQENAYYICNKITFKEGDLSDGEFIKINKI